MVLRLRPLWLCSFVVCLAFACGSESNELDANGDNVPDDIGKIADANKDGKADTIDINKDGKADGWALDTNDDGVGDALALDTDCDGIFESYDVNGDGKADYTSKRKPAGAPTAGCDPGGLAGTAGSGVGGSGSGTAGSGTSGSGTSGSGTGGSGTSGSGTGGSGTSGSGTGGSGVSMLGSGVYQGNGNITDQYAEDDVFRDGVGYKFIANGWGQGWQNHQISYKGTSFNVLSLNGTQGSDYSPAGYPTMFCGLYSKKQSPGGCGLPGAASSLKQVKTGWRWKANGNAGQYNAAWDIWLGDGGNLSSYLMVWLRDPPGQQPAGSANLAGATVAGLPGSWNIWTGSVNGHPIVNYIKAEGQDLSELEFDVLDVYKDAMNRKYNLPGSQIMAVAVGFEIWNGPVTNLQTEDFYVDVK